MVDAGGLVGPLASATIEVNDATPPTVNSASPAYGSPDVRVEFSEPVDDSAALAQNYALIPHIDVHKVRRGRSDHEVILQLGAAPELERVYELRIAGVKDCSPAHNRMKPASIELKVRGPVLSLAHVRREQMGSEIRDVPGLPIAGTDNWTLNLFVRTDRQPDDKTVIAGFGRCEQAVDGAARYLCRFPGGVQFWSHNRDVAGRTPLDLGRWQMLTATYDGHTVRLYKDAQLLGQRDEELSDDENVVRIAPLDPWDGTRRFDGQIRDLTIWNSALGEDAIRSIAEAGAAPAH